MKAQRSKRLRKRLYKRKKYKNDILMAHAIGYGPERTKKKRGGEQTWEEKSY